MDKEIKESIIIVVSVVLIFSMIIGGLYVASGVNPPFTVVKSASMQHDDDKSMLGVIDTGDMVVVKDTSKMSITSYVEGYASGYTNFGNYGDVIIYDRGEDKNPVIHRAIIWMDYNGNGTWSAPALKDYNDNDGKPLWSATGGNDYNNLSGILTFNELNSERGKYSDPVTINLDNLSTASPQSGYLTKGDNNSGFDQMTSIIPTTISEDMIKSVAWLEVPWLGSVKLYLNDNPNISVNAPNSIICLAVFMITIIFTLFAISNVVDYVRNGKMYQEFDENQ